MKDSFQISGFSFETKNLGNSPPHPDPLPPWGEGKTENNIFLNFIIFVF